MPIGMSMGIPIGMSAWMPIGKGRDAVGMFMGRGRDAYKDADRDAYRKGDGCLYGCL